MNKEGIRALSFWLSRKINYPLVSPDVIQIPLVSRCNLRCKMCTIPENPSHHELSKEEIFDIILQANGMGIKETVLTGGEPLLRKELFDIVSRCKANGIRSVVTTNGALIDEQLAEKVVLSDISHLHFSVDGMEKSHDFFRGQGNFSKTSGAIKTVNKLRGRYRRSLSIGIACTVMDNNLEDLVPLLEYADSLSVDVINFQPLLKDNAKTPDRGDVAFWIKDDRMNVLEKALKGIIEFKGRHINIYQEPKIGLFAKYFRRTLGFSDWKCFGGYKTIFVCIGDDGSPLVYTCHGICGNLRQNTLKECWMSDEAMRLRRGVKKCKNPCLQSCYSRISSESLVAVFKKIHA